MPRIGAAIPIDKTWKDRVRARIAFMKISQNELARRAGITISSLSAALSPSSKQTTVMREIHRALDWEPPPVITPDSLELMRVVEQLTDRQQGELLGRARSMLADRTKPPR